MKKPKIIFLTSQVINKRDYKRFAINTIENKSEISIIDFTYLLQPGIFEKQLKLRKKNLNTIFIKNLNQLEFLKNNFEESDLIISILGCQNELNNLIYKFFKPYEKKICLVNISALPLNPLNKKYSFFKKLYCLIFSERIFLLINKFRKIFFIIKRFFFKSTILKPGYIAVCGEEVINSFSKTIDNNTKIIKTCSYDLCLAKVVKKKLLDYRYFVFLDEYLIKHSDFKILNKSIEKENIYYKELNKFFKFIEINFKVKVVIASHPRADLAYNKSKFPTNQVFIDKTPQLMKYAEACITHASTSINFAVIFNKPIIFITTDRMIKTRYTNELLSSWFNKTPLNISQSYTSKKIISNMSIEKIYMKEYFKKFIGFSEDIEFGFSSFIDSMKIKR